VTAGSGSHPKCSRQFCIERRGSIVLPVVVERGSRAASLDNRSLSLTVVAMPGHGRWPADVTSCRRLGAPVANLFSSLPTKFKAELCARRCVRPAAAPRGSADKSRNASGGEAATGHLPVTFDNPHTRPGRAGSLDRGDSRNESDLPLTRGTACDKPPPKRRARRYLGGPKSSSRGHEQLMQTFKVPRSGRSRQPGPTMIRAREYLARWGNDLPAPLERRRNGQLLSGKGWHR
jgi:hypothetical protein